MRERDCITLKTIMLFGLIFAIAACRASCTWNKKTHAFHLKALWQTAK